MRAALVLGGGSTLWADVEQALSLGEFQGVVAVNDAAVVWGGPLDAVASYHSEKWPLWLERRRRRGYAPPARVFGHEGFAHRQGFRPDIPVEWVNPLFPRQKDTGSSGCFAAKVALVDLDFDRIVLCGVPMNAGPHFWDHSAWTACDAHRQGWAQIDPSFTRRMRSCSGWTRDRLGAPTAAWLCN